MLHETVLRPLNPPRRMRRTRNVRAALVEHVVRRPVAVGRPRRQVNVNATRTGTAWGSFSPSASAT